jgi:hypothetical protein
VVAFGITIGARVIDSTPPAIAKPISPALIALAAADSATIPEVQELMDVGELSSVELVQFYLDRIDALGLHRLSLYSVGGIADVVADRLIAGKARIPADETAAVPITDAQLRRVAAAAPARWQLIHRVPRRDSGTRLVVESMVLRTGETRVDLVTRTPEGEGYQRMAVDAGSLRDYLRGLFTLR